MWTRKASNLMLSILFIHIDVFETCFSFVTETYLAWLYVFKKIGVITVSLWTFCSGVTVLWKFRGNSKHPNSRSSHIDILRFCRVAVPNWFYLVFWRIVQIPDPKRLSVFHLSFFRLSYKFRCFSDARAVCVPTHVQCEHKGSDVNYFEPCAGNACSIFDAVL